MYKYNNNDDGIEYESEDDGEDESEDDGEDDGVKYRVPEADPDLLVRNDTLVSIQTPLAEIKGDALVLQSDRVHKGRDDDVDHRNDDRQQEQAQKCVAAVQDDLILFGVEGHF